jgi:hypothetical protein
MTPTMDTAMADMVAERGWWMGYHGQPARIDFKVWQPDYIRGYQEGFRYAGWSTVCNCKGCR